MATMQGLKTFLTAPESECKFSELNTAIQSPNIHCKITFWGKRVITVQGEEGSVSLYELSDKVVSIIRSRCLSPTAWPSNETPDKEQARLVVDRLSGYYSQTETLIAGVNFLTWILAKIRGHEGGVTIAYLNCWEFPVGCKIPYPSFWGYDDVPDWVPRGG